MSPTSNLKKTKRLQDLTAAVAASEKKRMPGQCEGSCTCPTGSAKANFNILHEVLGLVKKLAKKLQIWCALRRRNAHFVGRRRELGFPKAHFFAWFVPSSLFPGTPRKESAVYHQAEPGGDEDDLGWGQAFCDRRPVHRQLPVVVGAHWKVRSNRQYIGEKFWENTFFQFHGSM